MSRAYELFEGVTVLSFNAWKDQEGVHELLLDAGECDVCHGAGSHDCECGDTHECRACEGTGHQIKLRDLYEKELRAEIHKLRAWRDGTPLGRESFAENKHQSFQMVPIVLAIHGEEKGEAGNG